MTSTDPAGFNSETTGVFKVQPLGQACIAADAGMTVERLEARAHVDEYGHPSDCNGCAAPMCGPPERADEYGDPDHLAERLEAQAHGGEQPLSEQYSAMPVQDTPYGYLPPAGKTAPILRQSPVSLVYAHSDGYTFTRVDTENLLTHSRDGSDGDHRERLLLRALLQHTLAMLNGEDVS